MCRYAFTSYKPHFACFNCRKTFKRKLLSDIQGGINKKDEENPAKCPECDKIMANMGLDFEAPKRNNIKAWNHMSTLYKVGITFHSCGCSGPGFIPRDNNELLKYFEEIKNDYLNHQHFWAQRRNNPEGQSEVAKDEHKNSDFLHSIPNGIKSGTKNKPKYNTLKAQFYWNERVKEIEEKIQTITNANNMYN